jgi:uncharacterized BrkB/YihY/UPF0761 family membrane protein
MDQEIIKNNEKKCKRTRPVLLIWVVPLLLLILLTIITVVGVYLLESSDGSIASQVKSLGVLIVIIAVISLLIGALSLYSSMRYMQIPIWRWIAKGFKGEPDLPWIRKPQKPEIKDER